MTNLDHYFTNTLGFDKLFVNADSFFNNLDKFPFHNIIKEGDLDYTIELALAGFGKTDLNVQLKEGSLIIKGEKSEEKVDTKQFLHKGIGTRKFTKTFRLSDTMDIEEASFDNGILSIKLHNNLPKDKQPKNIKVK